MNDTKLQTWWAHRQGLDGSMQGKSAAEVLRATGWARSVGGSGPYLGLFARAGLSREQVDSAVSRIEIHELPSARGCTYVLPAADFTLGLKLAGPFSNSERKVALKLGVTESEIEKLCEAVVAAVSKEPLDPEQIRQSIGSAVRSLGEEGTKKGLSSTLPVALEALQASGDIRRVPVNGRLDQQRYRYVLWKPNPLAQSRISAEEANTQLAHRYFEWIGPATIAEFQQFSGLGVKAAKASVEPLRLAPAGDRWILPEDRDAFENFHIPKTPDYVLTSSIDGHVLLRRDLSQLLDPADLKRPLLKGSVHDLPSHPILDRGRIMGLWEFDPETSTIAWQSFIPASAALKAAVARMEAFVRDQLGDARSFSLDSPKSRRPRIDALRS